MLYFDSDYREGAHPELLARLGEENWEPMPGYGEDPICERAREKIRAACGCPEGEIYFLTGGTQTNAVVIRALLRLYEGVIAADTGHIATHEAGAIEAGGHKVIPLPEHAGKLDPGEVADCLAAFQADPNRAHTVKPGMVYLSHPTEYGALYTREELEALHQVCQSYHVPLYLDGARLGYALAVPGSDVTLPVLAQTCDVFYIGGTKVGAMFGEAVVFPRPLADQFFTVMKQSGALLAKGRYLGIQFDALFSNDLYLQCGRAAIQAADRLRAALRQKGYQFYVDSPTNQLFVILDRRRLAALREQVSFAHWRTLDQERAVVRFATSWATRPEDVDALIALL